MRLTLKGHLNGLVKDERFKKFCAVKEEFDSWKMKMQEISHSPHQWRNFGLPVREDGDYRRFMKLIQCLGVAVKPLS
jgi:tRNA U34 5-carboxymethylaminomethyl modifying enzyme MnmG/GidA